MRGKIHELRHFTPPWCSLGRPTAWLLWRGQVVHLKIFCLLGSISPKNFKLFKNLWGLATCACCLYPSTMKLSSRRVLWCPTLFRHRPKPSASQFTPWQGSGAFHPFPLEKDFVVPRSFEPESNGEVFQVALHNFETPVVGLMRPNHSPRSLQQTVQDHLEDPLGFHPSLQEEMTGSPEVVTPPDIPELHPNQIDVPFLVAIGADGDHARPTAQPELAEVTKITLLELKAERVGEVVDVHKAHRQPLFPKILFPGFVDRITTNFSEYSICGIVFDL